MSAFLAGFFSALPILAVVLAVRWIKDGFRAGIKPDSSFSE